MQVKATTHLPQIRKSYTAGQRMEANAAVAPQLPVDGVTLSAEALSTKRSSAALRKAGMVFTMGLALVLSLGAAGCVAHKATPEPVVVTRTVEAPPSPYRQLGREVHEIGQQGKEVGQQVGRAGKQFGKEVGAAAKDFWQGVRGN